MTESSFLLVFDRLLFVGFIRDFWIISSANILSIVCSTIYQLFSTKPGLIDRCYDYFLKFFRSHRMNLNRKMKALLIAALVSVSGVGLLMPTPATAQASNLEKPSNRSVTLAVKAKAPPPPPEDLPSPPPPEDPPAPRAPARPHAPSDRDHRSEHGPTHGPDHSEHA